MKKLSIFGKSVPLLALVMISIIAVGAIAATLDYYGYIEKTVTVTQAVQLDEKEYTEPIIVDLGSVPSGTTICQLHKLENTGTKPAVIDWDYTVSGPGMTGLGHGQGIEVLILESVNEAYDNIGIGALVEATVAKTWECSVTTWVIDIINVGPHYGVGLVISLDGINPSFQVWYREYQAPFGWYYQEWTGDGWNGWGGPEIPIAAMPGITATGDETGQHFEISIDCEYMCGAGKEYYWNMQVRTNLFSWLNEPTSGWEPAVSGFIVNWTGTELVFPLTLNPGEARAFNLAINLDPLLIPGVYVVTTTFMPAP